ncbi:hypothetical protein RVR_1668 [Actinacidiphila reveromycinica]|uniref:Uncharacterized protein n=1 Tax=Actinacidiphila reveromycinica TaxID=659352 RepID=A0A7U3UPN7_9ACTN|nr:hypothetical protein [Streptomyces sp. SN-593]BBA96397.1 hypothetical protein RVR_1668 [Streptomyces sp. SN-593]
MTGSAGRDSRRAVNARKRISRRPSRLGTPAGSAPGPDRRREPAAGFPGLLDRVWERARAAGDPREALEVLLGLDGHVPRDVQLRALGTSDEAAVMALWGVSWRAADLTARAPAPGADPGNDPAPDPARDDERVFLGELGLATSGRIVLRAPSQGPLDRAELVGGVLRVPWSRRAARVHRDLTAGAAARTARALADCRGWLDGQGGKGRDELVEQAKEAALRTAPFVLYQEDRQYTNFRDQNTITGKTLWPGHPDCVLSGLRGLPLDLWSDSDVQMLIALTLLVRSAGFGRVEEANGTQLGVDHVAAMLERVRRSYAAVPGGAAVAPAGSHRVEDLMALAEALGARRREVAGTAQLYREIHGALMHKIERVATETDAVRTLDARISARLVARLPLAGDDLAGLGLAGTAPPLWLAEPHGQFATGLESLVHETVAACAEEFRADFAMSRGMRSLPELIDRMRAERWAEICDWDITRYFCCVVPRPEARVHFGGSAATLADTAWAMSSRMQYNSWHFVPGNLPRDPAVVARDHFVPPTIPDIAFFSDQHHHGHVANKVRFSIRSPQAVEVAGRVFNGFTDLRLLRCAGEPFDERDLLVAHRVSGFLARATGLAARLAARGVPLAVTSFDAAWHWRTIAGDDGDGGDGGPAGRGGAVRSGPAGAVR